MQEKLCPQCKRVLPVSAFAKNSSKSDGLQTHCRECKKNYDAQYYKDNTEYHRQYVKDGRRRLRDQIVEYKAERGCKYCPENDPCCLDFHHPGDDKDFAVSDSRYSGCTQKVFAEIAKCEVICANCHRKLHAGKLNIESVA